MQQENSVIPAKEFFLADEQATVALGERIAELLPEGGVVFLEGTLGAGKTTFARGVLRYYGYSGAVKSPTYTLVEPYRFGHITVYHFDLYRLGEPEELEFMGIRDYFSSSALCLVEWPQRGHGFLPRADLCISLSPRNGGRLASLMSLSQLGEKVVLRLKSV